MNLNHALKRTVNIACFNSFYKRVTKFQARLTKLIYVYERLKSQLFLHETLPTRRIYERLPK